MSEDMSSEKEKDIISKTLRIVLVISIVVNLVLVIIGVIAANSADTKYKQGFYDGQSQTYKWMQDWGYGKFIHRDGSADFQFKDKEKVIYIYNRTKFPDERKYPTGRPPATGEAFAPH